MTIEALPLAEKVVEIFKNELNDAARELISDTEFQKLALMIREALSEELEEVTEMIEEVVRKLKAKTERPDLDL